MRYTRYNIKKRRKNNKAFFVILIVILMTSFFIGTLISNIFLKDRVSNLNTSNNKKDSFYNKSKEEEKGKPISFVLFQCGVFENSDNAKAMIDILKNIGYPYMIEDGSKKRIFFGIFNKEKEKEIEELLSKNGVNYNKAYFNIENNNLGSTELGEMINANIKIIDKLYEKEVKAFQTAELKKWVNSLKTVEKNNKYITLVNEYKEYINKLPENIDKNKISDNYAYIYKILKKYTP